MIATTLGGIGLFLLGMVLLTDGLKAAAGNALRNLLGRFTGGTLRAVVSGAAVTGLVQSSSATVLTTIGFVSAGLLTLRQAIGVVFGANVGTTSTGWLVSLLGLKLSIGALALPLVGIGALLRLLTRDRVAAAGLSLAGFGLIFVGIDVLQQGMAALGERIDTASLPGATVNGRLLLVAVGAAMTVVMQSSSAAVATTLTALHAGTIGMEQAAALVVGQNIGTTVTAALAAIGATVPAKRTAVAHILFNALTGVIAFVLVPAAVHAERVAAASLGGVDAAVLIAAFHTLFNVFGVVLLAPAIDPFTRLVERIIPQRGRVLTRHLDPSVATLPPVAVEATRRATMDIAASFLALLSRLLRNPRRSALPTRPFREAVDALRETRRFLGTIRTSTTAAEHARHLAVLHSIEHLGRLAERLDRHTPDAPPPDDDSFDRLRIVAADLVPPSVAWLTTEVGAAPVDDWRAVAARIAAARRDDRGRILALAASGDVDPDDGLARLEAMRWLDSVAYHAWRAIHHLAATAPAAPPQPADTAQERTPEGVQQALSDAAPETAS